MSVSFDIYRVAHTGARDLVYTTQSAREAREIRDAANPGEMLVVGRDLAIETDGTAQDIEGDYPI